MSHTYLVSDGLLKLFVSTFHSHGSSFYLSLYVIYTQVHTYVYKNVYCTLAKDW